MSHLRCGSGAVQRTPHRKCAKRRGHGHSTLSVFLPVTSVKEEGHARRSSAKMAGVTTRTGRLLASTALLVAGCSSDKGERSADTAVASSHGTSTPTATVMSTSTEPVVSATAPDTTTPDVTESADTSAAPDTTTASTSTTTTTVVDEPPAAGHTGWIETSVDTARRTE